MKRLMKKVNLSEFEHIVLGADIGGTNTHVGIAGVKKNKYEFLSTVRAKTKEIRSLPLFFKEYIETNEKKFNIKIKKACIGAAGLVDPTHEVCVMTNFPLTIRAKEILKKTSLDACHLVNDFELIGYAINLLNEDDPNTVLTINKGKRHDQEPKAVLGAGTGLGKSILRYDPVSKYFIPLQSEGGHEDFPVHDSFELDLLSFIKKRKKINTVRYEDVLSGQGIEQLYLFLRSTKKFPSSQYTKEIDQAKEKNLLIGKYLHKDQTCQETAKLFVKFFARCSKNFVLDTLPRGGFYLAGGIIPKYPHLFQSALFKHEYLRTEKHVLLLSEIPMFLIHDPLASLKGAFFAAIHNEHEI